MGFQRIFFEKEVPVIKKESLGLSFFITGTLIYQYPGFCIRLGFVIMAVAGIGKSTLNSSVLSL